MAEDSFQEKTEQATPKHLSEAREEGNVAKSPEFNSVFILFFGLVVIGLVAYGLYLTVGAGKKSLRDPIDEHAKMHELGIAHGHGGNKEMSGKLSHKHED